jgi:Leucine-rich repeat (LRR) protein
MKTNFDVEKYFNNLSDDVKCIYISEYSLTYIPDLSRFTKLEILKCMNNRLTFLPPLPASLEILHCYWNKLTMLPPLPPNLKELLCYDNKLTFLPILPSSLMLIHCSNNNIQQYI